jgi:hypothetical protein
MTEHKEAVPLRDAEQETECAEVPVRDVEVLRTALPTLHRKTDLTQCDMDLMDLHAIDLERAGAGYPRSEAAHRIPKGT